MTDQTVYLEYLKERKFVRRFTRIRKLLSFFFIGVYLYFLFSSKYTASPFIVLINMLAIFTSFSGIIFFKVFEIPKCILEIRREIKNSSFFSLADDKRDHILKNTFIEMGISPFPENVFKFGSEQISNVFELEKRLPWKKIGLVYLLIYLVTVVITCIFLFNFYRESRFDG